ncbi:hypothetical protein FDK21_17345 [Cohaesibacter sp. CAU 1516]|uniref:hypothetical protein n=1 Tax=Cohaesibacter sp. CAU 1516 TaxID=2576038 RepID=UPI0010FEF7D5|nr:hypothetical protein [Cohaesibacter sp. CAU 1516]TLP43328.1 hypothetical protein FDK21_17345 [Cohaesibacter sp. CAU 1516]
MTNELKDVFYIAGMVVSVAGSHFMLRARVMVLEERVRGYSKAIERVFDSLKRIEEKLDEKADK